MPITLVTGLPGHGKTLWTLARFKPEAEKAGRPVFHNNIPGLNIPNWQTFDLQDWEKLPTGALVVVDEAQFAFPATKQGGTPPWVQKLATHRHLGLDFVVITQNPMLLDSFVRRLVDRHFHVVRKFGTQFATIYEFVNGAREDCAKNKKDSIRHEWRYNKDVFNWYKSAELHTVKRRIPARVFLLVVLPFIFVGLVWLAWTRLNPDVQKGRAEEMAGPSPAASGSLPGQRQAGQQQQPAGKLAQLTTAEYSALHQPRIAGLPHTAPVYDEVTKPVSAPYPAACVVMREQCRCYSQQGTRLDTPADICKGIADGGFFVSWNTSGAGGANGGTVVPAVPLGSAAGVPSSPSPSPSLEAHLVANRLVSLGGDPRSHVRQ